MRLLHTADLHLGQILYQYYDRVDEHDHFFAQLRDWCERYTPDALLVSGDIFDIPQPSAATKAYFNHTFAELHKAFPAMTIVVTAGNHDSASRIEADSMVWGLSDVVVVGHSPAADVLNGKAGWEERFIVALPTGFVVALPYMTASRRDVVQALMDNVAARNEQGLPVVLMGHLAVSGSDFLGHSEIGTLKSYDAAELGDGYDYAALGHIHRPQTLSHDINDEMQAESHYPAGIMRYSGSALHVSCDETYPHSVSLVDIDRHGGAVTVQRLRIDELRHFYILPSADRPPIDSETTAMLQINDFLASHSRGYIRLRIDYHAKLPANFIQQVYTLLEATGNEVRLNPKTIWENVDENDETKAAPTFGVAELQQMGNPLEFIKKTINKYHPLTLEELEEDFAEIEKVLQKEGENH
ncbi:MAG: exonuclease subunit SbcD [Bacteroidales bacterium]|nr:exonuclease subunit SbcD [Bacteroidales bacterium]